jgi:amino acid transporter
MTRKRLSLLQAVCLNMAMMVGIGPFITIPSLIAAMNGPQAMLGWLLGALIALCDGMVWSELAAAYPGSGGTYHYFDQIYQGRRLGRLLKFLFVWQFLLSAPLEAASGAIGLARYAGYWFPQMRSPAWRLHDLGFTSWSGSVGWDQLLAAVVMIVATAAASRRIQHAGRILVILWVGVATTLVWVACTGLAHFDPRLAFDFPADPWRLDAQNARGLGLALSIALYDFLGYYQVCYLAEEVENPVRNIPRAILISTLIVAAFYVLMNTGILGVIPWRAVASSRHIVSDLMEQFTARPRLVWRQHS